MACPECGAEYPVGHTQECSRRIPSVRAYCMCGGTGVRKVVIAGVGWNGRYEKCDCGRLMTSKGMKKLDEQAKLDRRLEQIRRGAW